MFKKLRWIALASVFMGITAPASTHTLKETTAQITLREGQVVVKVITATDHLIEALQNDQAWLLGDIDTIMPANLAPKEQQAFIEKALKQKTSLKINKQAISFERVTFSNTPETGSGEVIFQARHSFPDVSALSITFHKGLGTVHVSVVKPQYKLLKPGESAQVVF